MMKTTADPEQCILSGSCCRTWYCIIFFFFFFFFCWLLLVCFIRHIPRRRRRRRSKNQRKTTKPLLQRNKNRKIWKQASERTSLLHIIIVWHLRDWGEVQLESSSDLSYFVSTTIGWSKSPCKKIVFWWRNNTIVIGEETRLCLRRSDQKKPFDRHHHHHHLLLLLLLLLPHESADYHVFLECCCCCQHLAYANTFFLNCSRRQQHSRDYITGTGRPLFLNREQFFTHFTQQ